MKELVVSRCTREQLALCGTAQSHLHVVLKFVKFLQSNPRHCDVCVDRIRMYPPDFYFCLCAVSSLAISICSRAPDSGKIVTCYYKSWLASRSMKKINGYRDNTYIIRALDGGPHTLTSSGPTVG